jgi:hypothetical protein
MLSTIKDTLWGAASDFGRLPPLESLDRVHATKKQVLCDLRLCHDELDDLETQRREIESRATALQRTRLELERKLREAMDKEREDCKRFVEVRIVQTETPLAVVVVATAPEDPDLENPLLLTDDSHTNLE